MPNWAYTDYVVTGDNKKVNEMFSMLERLNARKRPLAKSDFGKLWLGNIVLLLGKHWKDVYCRGSIQSYQKSFDNQNLFLAVESAWGEMNEVRELLQQKFPSLQVYYYVEEPGMEIYSTNDQSGKYFPSRYVVYSDEEGTEYFNCVEDVAEYLGRLGLAVQFDSSAEDCEKAVNKWNETHPDSWVNLYRIKVRN